MKPNDSSIGELSNDDVYDVFHQTVNKLHGVWNDMLAAKAPKVQSFRAWSPSQF